MIARIEADYSLHIIATTRAEGLALKFLLDKIKEVGESLPFNVVFEPEQPND